MKDHIHEWEFTEWCALYKGRLCIYEPNITIIININQCKQKQSINMNCTTWYHYDRHHMAYFVFVLHSFTTLSMRQLCISVTQGSHYHLPIPRLKIVYIRHISTSSRQHDIHCILVILLTTLQCCILDELSLTRYIWCYEVCTDIWAILKGKHACIETTTSIFGVNRITDPQRAWCWHLWCLLI